MYSLDHSDQGIFTWSGDGKSFIIKDKTRLEKEVLPKNFKDAKFNSFLRKVCLEIKLYSRLYFLFLRYSQGHLKYFIFFYNRFAIFTHHCLLNNASCTVGDL